MLPKEPKLWLKASKPLLERDRDKNPVVALREIADNVLDLEATKSDLVKGLQKFHEEVLVDPDEKEIETNDQLVDENLIKDLEENADDAGLSIEENQ